MLIIGTLIDIRIYSLEHYGDIGLLLMFKELKLEMKCVASMMKRLTMDRETRFWQDEDEYNLVCRMLGVMRKLRLRQLQQPFPCHYRDLLRMLKKHGEIKVITNG